MHDFSQVDQILRDAAQSGDIPGVVAMAATVDGPVYKGAFGIRQLPAGAGMTLDSIFWIASMTKAITSTAAMQLVEQQKLSLDDPIREVLPELSSPQVLEGFDEKGEPTLRPAKRAITLRHLLTHTAGFGYDIWNPNLLRYQEKLGIPGVTSCLNIALTTPLTFDPGDKWDYGVNIDWVGKAVEKVSKKDLEIYFREHIFDPLGMSDTGFALSDERRARMVGMHARQADGELQPMPFEIPQDPEFYMGGGGLYGSAPDYLKFQQMILHHGRFNGAQILKPDTVKLMSNNNIGDLNVRKLTTAIPPYSNDAEFFPGMVKKWGLGFMINTEAASGAGRSAGSLTWAGLGNTYFWIDPTRQVAGVILTQLVPFADSKVLALYDKFERAIYQAMN